MHPIDFVSLENLATISLASFNFTLLTFSKFPVLHSEETLTQANIVETQCPKEFAEIQKLIPELLDDSSNIDAT